MAGLTGHMSTVVKAKVSKMLDKAEDPAETLDYSYQKQVEQLQNVKKGIADVVPSRSACRCRRPRSSSRSSSSTPRPAKRSPAARRICPPGPGAQERRADRAAVARHPGRRTQGPADETGRLRAEAARQDRSLPHQEGGHQGAVLRRRRAGADFRSGHRGGRADGRRRLRDAARGGQDRKHEGPCQRRHRAEAAGTFDDITALGSGEDDIDRQLKQLSSTSAVDDDLAKLKAEVGAGPHSRRGGGDPPAGRSSAAEEASAPAEGGQG